MDIMYPIDESNPSLPRSVACHTIFESCFGIHLWMSRDISYFCSQGDILFFAVRGLDRSLVAVRTSISLLDEIYNDPPFNVLVGIIGKTKRIDDK